MATDHINTFTCPATTRHAVLILSFIFPAISAVTGQAPGAPANPTDPYPYAKFSPSMAIIIAVLVTALFFMGFFSIYIRRCSQSGTGGSVRATLSMRSRRAAAARGLDAQSVDALPTLAYSEVKGLHIGKGALECAVCLNEFQDDETLRLLPKCDHVFHLECIDMWLASHTTCPVCRADLVPVAGEPAVPLQEPVPSPANDADNVVASDDQPQVEVHVTIIPDENEEKPTSTLLELPKPDIIKRAGSVRVNRPPRSGSVRSMLVNIFPRSHSTGHSLVQQGENVDRYSLCPIHFFTLSFLGCPNQFFTFQNFPKIVKFYYIKINYIHYFPPLYSFYTIYIYGSHHFTNFSHFSLLSLYISLVSVPNPFDNKWVGRREYTLRLPEEVRNGIIKRALERTGSVATSTLAAGEASVQKGNQIINDEGSSKGTKSYKRLGSSERKSDRWGFSRMPSFLSRALSTRSKVVAGDGEASGSSEPGGNNNSVRGDGAGSKDKLPV